MSLSRGNDLALAMRLADAADSITMARYQSLDLDVTTKPDNTPVTDADKASEEAIRALLKSHRPDDGIVGEETDIAEAVLWICSVKSKYINGAVLRIDGGGSTQEQFTLINSKNIEFRG